MSIKFVPFYFPQFYSIPENDTWWGDGYTDWERVKKVKPLFSDQNQPRIPLMGDYYDQSKAETVMKQIQTAVKYGIHGFNFYHYWFDGKLLLEKPINIFKELDHELNFCVTWANESWTKRWVGKANEVLIRQNHFYNKKEWDLHFNYLNTFFLDRRYMKIDEKPIFCIYRPDLINNIDEFIDFFNEKAVENGYAGIYFIGLKAYEINVNKSHKNFDAIMRFQPRDIFNSELKTKNKAFLQFERILRQLPENILIHLGAIMHKMQGMKSYNYDQFWSHLLENAIKDNSITKEILQSIVVDWDNTARYGSKATFFEGNSPEKFDKYVGELIKIIKMVPQKKQIIFVNAWNEWTEGAYLEPDTKNGYKYLEILAKYAKKDL